MLSEVLDNTVVMDPPEFHRTRLPSVVDQLAIEKTTMKLSVSIHPLTLLGLIHFATQALTLMPKTSGRGINERTTLSHLSAVSLDQHRDENGIPLITLTLNCESLPSSLVMKI
jgi:hypothetical protein